jgi:hypothetical protein
MDELDTDILFNTSSLIINEDQGRSQLLAAAGNSEDPAVGVAQFIMMLMQSISEMLQSAGLDVNPEAWLAKGGAVDLLLDEVAEILGKEGIDVGPDFENRVMPALLERVKGAAQAESVNEQSQAAPQGGGLLGMV